MDGYQPGDVILKSEPFAYILSSRHRGKRCDSCLKLNESLKRCGSCRIFYFCDRSCQRRTWQIHKEECARLKPLREVPPDLDCLVARVIIRLKQDGQEFYEEVMSHRRTFASLISHVEELKEQKESMLRFSHMQRNLKSYLGPELMPSTTDLLVIFGKVIVNSYGIYDEEIRIIGSGLYLGASILDHSCFPNAAFVFESTALSVRALKCISGPKNDLTKVFICYIDQVQRTEQRKSELREQYFFDCCCEWCTSNCMEESMSEILVCGSEKELSSLVTELKQALDSEGELESLFDRGLQALGPYCSLGPYNVLRSQLLNLLFDAAIMLQKWDEAVSVGLQYIPIARLYLGKFSPSFGIVLMKIGKVLLFLENLDQSREILLQARDVLSVTHGRDTGIYTNVLDLLYSCDVPLS